jgi:hypothetical protein
MKSSKWAGMVMIAGAGILFGCEQSSRNQDAANSNATDSVATASTQGAASTTQPGSVTAHAAPSPAYNGVLEKDRSVAAGIPAQEPAASPSAALTPGTVEDFN